MFKSLNQRFGKLTIEGRTFQVVENILQCTSEDDESFIRKSGAFNKSIIEETESYNNQVKAYEKSIQPRAIIIFTPEEESKLAKLPPEQITLIHDNAMSVYAEHFDSESENNASGQGQDNSAGSGDENKYPTEQELLDIRTHAEMEQMFERFDITNYDKSLGLRGNAAVVWAAVQAKQNEEQREKDLKNQIV